MLSNFLFYVKLHATKSRVVTLETELDSARAQHADSLTQVMFVTICSEIYMLMLTCFVLI